MKFGIFYELQMPRPWVADGELTLYQNALDQVELADRLGYDFAWEVEHHFLEEYSHSPAPEVFLAAASQRTKNIRLAHGIMQLTTTHPARFAERIGALDLVSRGRVEFGTGESASSTELEPFGVAYGEKRAKWEEAIQAIIPMFKDGGSEHHGRFFDMPLRNVLPKPIQKPHPPIWVACSALETIEMAGRRGLGALAFQFLSADAAHAWVHAYYNAFVKRQEKLADYQLNPNIALICSSCAPDRRGGAAPRRRHHVLPVLADASTGGARPASGRRRAPSASGTNTTSGRARTLKLGRRAARRPDRLAETIRHKLPVPDSQIDQLILLNQAGKNTHEHICESLDCSRGSDARVPRDIRRNAWKKEVLAGEIELEDIDTAPFRDRYGPNSVQLRPQAAE